MPFRIRVVGTVVPTATCPSSPRGGKDAPIMGASTRGARQHPRPLLMAERTERARVGEGATVAGPPASAEAPFEGARGGLRHGTHETGRPVWPPFPVTGGTSNAPAAATSPETAQREHREGPSRTPFPRPDTVEKATVGRPLKPP